MIQLLSIKLKMFYSDRVELMTIGYCSKTQISKIIANFYDLKEETINDKISNLNFDNITPANLIKYLQDNKNIDDLYKKSQIKKYKN